MFNIKKFKLVGKLKNIKPQFDWIKFSISNKSSKTEFLNSIVYDKKFVREDLKLRAMVEESLYKEFGSSITEYKDYDFLVDSVVNKIKEKQLGNCEEIENL